jgi:hypothetical protein
MHLQFMIHEFHALTILGVFKFGSSLEIIYLILRSEACSLSSSNNSSSAAPLGFLLIYYQYSHSQKPSTGRMPCSWVSSAKNAHHIKSITLVPKVLTSHSYNKSSSHFSSSPRHKRPDILPLHFHLSERINQHPEHPSVSSDTTIHRTPQCPERE